MSIEDFIELFRSMNAYLMEPASEKELSGVLCSWLPEDYKELLRLANGVQAQGIRLLGTEPMPMAGGHMEPDLFWATQNAVKSDMIEKAKGHALGHITGNLLITHNEETSQYEVLDKSSGEAVYTFPTLIELLEKWKNWKDPED